MEGLNKSESSLPFHPFLMCPAVLRLQPRNHGTPCACSGGTFASLPGFVFPLSKIDGSQVSGSAFVRSNVKTSAVFFFFFLTLSNNAESYEGAKVACGELPGTPLGVLLGVLHVLSHLHTQEKGSLRSQRSTSELAG